MSEKWNVVAVGLGTPELPPSKRSKAYHSRGIRGDTNMCPGASQFSIVAASRARPSVKGAWMRWSGLLLLSGTICFLPSTLRQPLVQSHRSLRAHGVHRDRQPTNVGKVCLASQGFESDFGPAKRASNSQPSFAWRFLLSLVTGAMVGSIQYLYVVSRHLQDCEWTLKADGLARRAFPSYLSGTSTGWLSWAVSSGWTWLFADVAHTAAKLQAMLRATSGLLVGLLAVQLAWSSCAWIRGSVPDEKIGWRMWRTIIIWVVTVQASSLCCNLALKKLCVRSSWTGLPYYDEGHALCALCSILGGVIASTVLSMSLQNI